MNSQNQEIQKKVYISPELKEWGSIAEITLGNALKTYDTEGITFASVA